MDAVLDKINLPPEVCNRGIIDSAIEKGIILLLVFTPLAFGTVQAWSIAVMEIISFSLLILWLLKNIHQSDVPGTVGAGHGRLKIAGLAFFGIFAALTALQIIPMPYHIMSLLSPPAGKTYGTFLDDVYNLPLTLSLHPEATWEELLKLLSYSSVFLVVAVHYKTKEQLNKVFKTIVIMGCFLAVFAVVQKMTWNGRLFWFYPVQKGIYSDRAYVWGPYISHNHFAGYMEMAIPIGLGLLMYKLSNTRSLSHLSFPKRLIRFMDDREFLPAALLFSAVVIMSGALIISLSRGGLLGFLGSSFFFWFMIRSRRSIKKNSGIILLLGTAILLSVVISTFSRIEERFGEISIKEDERTVRLNIWSDSINIIKEFPVLGTGLGTFRAVYPRYQTKNSRLLFEHAENDYMELFIETGALGFLAVIGMIYVYFSSVVKAWRGRRNTFVKCVAAGGLASLVAILIHSLTDFNMRIPANAMLLTVIAAATYAAVFNMHERKKSLPFKERDNKINGKIKVNANLKRFYLTITILATVMLISFPVRSLLAEYHSGRVKTFLDNKETEHLDSKPVSADTLASFTEAIRSLEDAGKTYPRSGYYKAISNIYLRLGKWAEAMEAMKSPLPNGALTNREAYKNALRNIKKAIEMEPTNPDYHLVLANLYEATGDPASSDREFIRAVDAYPVNAPLRYAVARHYLLAGRNGDALEHARVLAKIDESYILKDSIQKRLMVEAMSQGYMYKSFLFSALEIAWRASEDPEVVKSVAPDNPDAREVVNLFMEWKGL